MNKDVLSLKNFPNVVMPGVIPYEQSSSWLEKFDVGIVPHLNNELTASMKPLKIFVYLTHGLQVVTTDIDNVDLEAVGVKKAETHEDFLKLLSDCLIQGKLKSEDVQNYVFKNSWDMRLGESIDQLLSNF
jgi:hypothetical protein